MWKGDLIRKKWMQFSRDSSAFSPSALSLICHPHLGKRLRCIQFFKQEALNEQLAHSDEITQMKTLAEWGSELIARLATGDRGKKIGDIWTLCFQDCSNWKYIIPCKVNGQQATCLDHKQVQAKTQLLVDRGGFVKLWCWIKPKI